MQVLSSPDVPTGEYVSLAFSPDSKYLVAQGGRPDWTLLYWTWEKSKVMATTKTSNPQNPQGDVYQVCVATVTRPCLIAGYLFLYAYMIHDNQRTLIQNTDGSWSLPSS